jgi:type II secretory pathway pseudopilin PulG
MKASQLLLIGLMVVGLSFASGQTAVAQTALHADQGEADRYQIYSLVEPEVFVENNRTFLLDSYTGAVFTRLGSGEAWTLYATGQNVSSFPTGGDWGTPRFELLMASTAETESKLVLTNTTSGAAYTRSPASGDWSPYRSTGSR